MEAWNLCSPVGKFIKKTNDLICSELTIDDNFNQHISLDEIADLVSMTVPAFCRFFKKTTGKTFTKLVNEYRVVHATKLLSESQTSITDICFECGFNNFSHFNKLFKEFTGKSASKYRSEMLSLIQ